MDKPTCRLCGSKHYASEPHKFESGKQSPVNKVVNNPAVNANVNTDEVNKLRSEIEKLKTRIAELEQPKPKVDRSAYMRDYMRKRRASK